MKLFSQTHEWVEVSGSNAVVGITNYAQKELGDIVYVELPHVGKQVQAGQEVVVLESTKAAADVYCPVSGKIVEVNNSLTEKPELVNSDCESEGWLFKINIENTSELENLLDEQAYLSSTSSL